MSATVPTSGGFVGPAWLQTFGSQFNAMSFLTRQIIAGKAFAAMVQVKLVSTTGALAPAGMVSVQPMVNQIDGLGNQVPHGTIYNLPFFRLQGGVNAIILDPVVDDIGLAVICDRDISVVKATGKVSGPGSFRQNDWADGCYFGGFLNGTPENVVQFQGGNINVIATGTIGLFPSADLNIVAGGNVTISSGSGTITLDGIVWDTHDHEDPQGGVTGPPI